MGEGLAEPESRHSESESRCEEHHRGQPSRSFVFIFNKAKKLLTIPNEKV